MPALPSLARYAWLSVATALVTMALKARRRPVVSGRDEMIGASGEVLEDFTGEGWARVHSETWRVSSARGQ